MRTTVTLDPDVEALLRKAMRERGLSFKQALNEAVRAGLAARPSPRRYRARTFDMGMPAPGIDLDKAIALAAALEDEEIIRKMSMGK